MKELQGTWYVTSFELEGNPMNPPGDARVVVDGDRFESLNMGDVYEGKLKIDASKKPMTLDMTFTAGPEKGNVNRGIFELLVDGWRLCLNTQGKARPKKFATTPGSGVALETLSRTRPAVAALGEARATAATGEQWVMASHIANGKPLEESYLQHGKRVVNGDEVTVTMAGQVLVQAKFTMTGGKIDYQRKDGKQQHGIYQESGDLLTVNFAAPGKPRPTALTSVKGGGHTLTVWKKVKA